MKSFSLQITNDRFYWAWGYFSVRFVSAVSAVLNEPTVSNFFLLIKKELLICRLSISSGIYFCLRL